MSSKEFTVPPVIFPSSSMAPPSANQRRGPPPSSANPYHPPQPPTQSLPFMSFDIGAAAAASSSSSAPPPLYSAGPIASSFCGPSSFEDESPLLEELGINTGQIWRKTTSVLNPLRPNPALHEDADLSGPFLFLMAFGLFQLLAGKFHFGIVLGWVTVAAVFLYFVFNMLTAGSRSGRIDLYRCVSLVGYCMVPLVLFSAVSLFLPRGGTVAFGVGMVFVLWSTRVCSRLLAEIAVCGDEHRGLIAYACWLVYMLFSLLIIF